MYAIENLGPAVTGNRFTIRPDALASSVPSLSCHAPVILFLLNVKTVKSSFITCWLHAFARLFTLTKFFSFNLQTHSVYIKTHSTLFRSQSLPVIRYYQIVFR